MTTIEDIEHAIAKLSPDELAAFRAWFEKFESDAFDRKIESTIRAGKLDDLAAQALSQHRKGLSTDL